MEDKNKQPGRVERTAQTAISKTAGKAIGQKIAQTATAKAIGSALGSTLGSAVPVIGNILGAFVGNLLGAAATKGLKDVGRVIGAIPFAFVNAAAAFGAAVAQAATISFGFLIGAAMVLVLFIGFMLFIINSGAYVAPGGGTIVTDGGTEGYQDCPSGGPSGWPVTTGSGQAYWIQQGPFTPSGWTHFGLEAIDVGLSSGQLITPNHTIIATHDGVVRWAGTDRYDGLFVDILGECSNGVPYRTRHVHFTTISSNIWNPVTDEVFQIPVTRGTILGVVGDTGYANSIHDHYEFRPAAAGLDDRFVGSPIPMQFPYIPASILRGCTTNCGTTIP